jgi:hypothetical protein
MSMHPSTVTNPGRLAGVLAALALSGAGVWAVGPLGLPASTEPRVPAAKVVSDFGLLASEGAGEPYSRVRPGEEVYSRDVLLCLPGLRTELEPRPHSVRLTLWGNLPQLSDSPVLESVVILHDCRAYDLDLTLVRGRIVLTNTRTKGPARVWFRWRAAGVLVTLAEPGDQAAVETYGRWPAGVPFRLKRAEGEAPVQFWEAVVLKGNVDITAGKRRFALSAPPGAASFRGDSLGGPDPRGPRRLAHLPAWADPKTPPPAEAVLIKGVVDAYRGRLKADKRAEAAAEVLALADKDTNRHRARMARELVVYTQGAADDLDAVVDALGEARHPEMRRAAVVALRHWIGVAPDRDQMVYKALVEEGYSKREAETVMQLLHTPFDPAQPETYSALLAYLGHDKLAVRELAYWHLVRLAPAGRDIRYDPAGSAEERAKGLAEWKKLIPSGSLPPEPKEKAGK